jgi:hypothetical protein
MYVLIVDGMSEVIDSDDFRTPPASRRIASVSLGMERRNVRHMVMSGNAV